ncbi:alpha-(1,6)-fucosyltransferase-like [Folsomia candida]|uniref:alpha-(1,6)-fucosyltransferase-like n=1 Tax=Folsomia candida TaxID=158441 RepID=UPI0016052CFE|nr:alpha-(1,6)-fucosyltransferase-like [Folsomia candida]
MLKSRRARILTSVVILSIFYYLASFYGHWGKRHCLTFWNEHITPHMFSAWRLTCNLDEEKSRLESFLIRGKNIYRPLLNANKAKPTVELLSNLVTHQIDAIQQKPCDQPNFVCGHRDSCGLACQLHHRIGCLLISYVTSMPLIHTVESDNWLYSNKWSDAFIPMGSNCTPWKNTFRWDWLPDEKPLSKCHNVLLDHAGTAIPYPLTGGIPISPEFQYILDSVKDQIPDPFIWMIGQFAKHAMRLNQTLEQEIIRWKKEIGFYPEHGTIVGLQIRRTDKTEEDSDTLHDLQEYFTHAETYFRKLETSADLGGGDIAPQSCLHFIG